MRRPRGVEPDRIHRSPAARKSRQPRRPANRSLPRTWPPRGSCSGWSRSAPREPSRRSGIGRPSSRPGRLCSRRGRSGAPVRPPPVPPFLADVWGRSHRLLAGHSPQRPRRPYSLPLRCPVPSRAGRTCPTGWGTQDRICRWCASLPRHRQRMPWCRTPPPRRHTPACRFDLLRPAPLSRRRRQPTGLPQQRPRRQGRPTRPPQRRSSCRRQSRLAWGLPGWRRPQPTGRTARWPGRRCCRPRSPPRHSRASPRRPTR